LRRDRRVVDHGHQLRVGEALEEHPRDLARKRLVLLFSDVGFRV